MLTTTSFEALARMQARALGDESLVLIVVEHPIGGIDAMTLRSRCAEASEQAGRWFGAEVARRRGTP